MKMHTTKNQIIFALLVAVVHMGCGSEADPGSATSAVSIDGGPSDCQDGWYKDGEAVIISGHDEFSKCEAEMLDRALSSSSQECEIDWVVEQIFGADSVQCPEGPKAARPDACLRSAVEAGVGAFYVSNSLGNETSTRYWRGVTRLGESATVTRTMGAEEGRIWVDACSQPTEWPASTECETTSGTVCFRGYRTMGVCEAGAGLAKCPS